MARRHAACGRNRRAARAQRKSCRNRRAVGTYSNIEPWRAESHDAQTANRSCSNGQRLACPSRCRRAPRLLHIRSSTCLSCRHHNACISLHHAVLPVLVHRDAVILCIARPRGNPTAILQPDPEANAAAGESCCIYQGSRDGAAGGATEHSE